MTPPRKQQIAAAVLVVLLAAAAGYYGHKEYRKRQLDKAVVALVADASLRIRDTLSTAPGRQGPDPLELARTLDDQAAELDRRLAVLQRMGPAPDPLLFDAAELYVVTARELLRRKAATYRNAVALAKSKAALQGLMREASRRSPTWISQTMRAKDQFENDAFNYRIACDAVASLLQSLPEARTGLTRQHVDPSLLVVEEGSRAKAEEQAREASRRTTEEVEEVRKFVAAR